MTVDAPEQSSNLKSPKNMRFIVTCLKNEGRSVSIFIFIFFFLSLLKIRE